MIQPVEPLAPLAAAIIAMIASAAAVLGALAKLLACVAEVRRSLARITASTTATVAEVSPNHGGSMRDAISRIETGQAYHAEMIKSLGHQIGEMHDQADLVHRSHEVRLRQVESTLYSAED